MENSEITEPESLLFLDVDSDLSSMSYLDESQSTDIHTSDSDLNETPVVTLGSHQAVIEQPLDGPSVCYGVTDPITLRLPTEKDRILTEQLEEMLHERNLYETASGILKRERLLADLSKLLCVGCFYKKKQKCV